MPFSSVLIVHITCYWKLFLLHYIQVLGQYRLCKAHHLYLRILCYNGSLVTWTVVSLTATWKLSGVEPSLTLRLTSSRPVCLGIKHPCGASFFFFCIVGGGVQTGSSRHVGHSLAYCTCPGWCEDGEFGGMNGRGNRSTRRKPAPTPLCPPQIPLDQTRDW
jgi:hypothetical protein